MRWFTICVALGLSACGKGKAPNDAAAPRAKPVPEAPGPPRPPSGGKKGKILLDRLQGTWVVGGPATGTVEAWQVTGDRVVAWDGSREATATLHMIAPCLVERVETALDGSTLSTLTPIALDGDTLHAGPGEVAVEDDGRWVSCGFEGVYVLAGSECLHWRRVFGKWEAEPARCSRRGEGAAGVLTVTANGTPTPLAAHGALHATAQFLAIVARKTPDWATAKAAVGPTGAPASP